MWCHETQAVFVQGAASKLQLGYEICQPNPNRLSIAMRATWSVITVLSVVIVAGCKTVPEQQKNTARTFQTVVVDAGHGGRDSGAYRRYGPPEKAATLDVAHRLSRKLRESQLHVVMTRTDDTFIPLDERVNIENSTKNSIFVSIHFNDSRRRGIKGYETYYHSEFAVELARRIQTKLLTMKGAVNRGVHVANFRVLRNATYPAVLVECGYLSNRGEGYEARSEDYRDQLADKIAEAIVEERYGAGVYRNANTAQQQERPPQPLPPPGEGPGLVPPTLGGHEQRKPE
jgi:N-acetylmuramoyl-L-alanine amidase